MLCIDNRVIDQSAVSVQTLVSQPFVQQVCLTLANNFSTGLWLSTALCCIFVTHLQSEIECHVNGHVVDQSAGRGHVATLRSNGVEAIPPKSQALFQDLGTRLTHDRSAVISFPDVRRGLGSGHYRQDYVPLRYYAAYTMTS